MPSMWSAACRRSARDRTRSWPWSRGRNGGRLRATRTPASIRRTIGSQTPRSSRRVVAERDGASCSGCIVIGVVMPWLADTDVGAAYGFARSIAGARTQVELRGRALQALAELVPADVLTWDRVELSTG